MKLSKFESFGYEIEEIHRAASTKKPTDDKADEKPKPFIEPPPMIAGILAGFLLQQIVKFLLMLR